MSKIKCGIIGATGYAGIELVRILTAHNNAEIAAASSHSFEGQRLSEIYPAMQGICDMTLENEDDVIEKSDVIFTSLPAGISEEIANRCILQGKKMIDLGADFRLCEEDYALWYGKSYEFKELHEKSIYSIPELDRDKITKDINVIGNPGCYPTSITLGLAPLAKAHAADFKSLIIDSKSGATGAGRGLSLNTHYTECNEAFSPYKIASHRHTPEIERNLSELCGETVKVTFVPHLLPVNRGIVSTMYVDLKPEYDYEKLYELYENFYKSEQFVRVMEKGQIANLKYVTYSNYCDISVHFDSRTNRAIIVAAIDNMVKGAAGQAVQNMNIMFGLDESEGLTFAPPAI